MPNGLSFVQPVSGVTDAGGAPTADPAIAAIEELLSRLEFATPQEPPRISAGRRILGSLGDAISAMAAIRAGGAPPSIGQFAAGQRERQTRFEQVKTAAETEKRETRNRVRIGAFEESQRREREESVKTIGSMNRFKPQIKVFTTPDESGRPIQVPYVFDANTQSLSPVQGYERGFHQYVRPFLAQGVNTETGELEFRLVDPFLPSPSPAAPSGGGAPGGGGGGRTVPGIEPKPTAGEAESVEAASVISGQLAEFKQRAIAYSKRKRILPTARALGQNVVRELPGGQALSETLGDPDFEAIAAIRDRIGQQLARLVESGRLSDQDREFALRNLPTVPALTTEEGRRTAAIKIEIVEKEIATRLARKGRLRPALVGGGTGSPTATGASSVDEVLRRYEEEYGGAAPTP